MLEFVKEKNELICIYIPEYGYDQLMDNLEKGEVYIKNTFRITKEDVTLVKDYDDGISFVVGKLENNYYLLDKNVLNLTHNIYLDKTINFTRDFKKYFTAYYNISIFPLIDEVINNDLYIDNDDTYVENDNHVAFEIFKKLISVFPNTTELKKYSRSRIAQILSEYFDDVERFNIDYEKYLSKKEKNIPTNVETEPNLLFAKLNLLKASHQQLTQMLSYPQKETKWQEKIKDIIGILFPKYLYTLREVNIGAINNKSKFPDFMLIDSNGYVDIMEIKIPGEDQVMRNAKVRNNYVPQKIFTDVMVQSSKYILSLNTNMDTVKKNIVAKLDKTYPSHGLTLDDIKINNPKAIVLFGRSNNLTKEQKDDFELIKRQYKDIPEIMTYDDLKDRICNLIESLEKQISLQS